MHTFQVLTLSFFNLCRFHLKPQDLPTSTVLLGLTLLSYTLINIVLSLAYTSLPQAILSSLIETLLLIVLVSSLLYVTHHPGRIIQSLTALAGADSVLGILSGPPMLWLHSANLNHSDMTIPLLVLLALIIWSLAVYAYVLRHALEVSFMTGFILSLLIFFLMTDALTLLFPSAS